jgi:hypothetical protein
MTNKRRAHSVSRPSSRRTAAERCAAFGLWGIGAATQPKWAADKHHKLARMLMESTSPSK